MLTDGIDIRLYHPCLENEISCPHCFQSIGRSCLHRNNEYLWFCLTPDCMKHNAKISKERDRKKWEEKIKIAQKKGEEEMKKRKAEDKKTHKQNKSFELED